MQIEPEQSWVPDREKEWRYTLVELQRMLKVNPDEFGDDVDRVRAAVESADTELRETGRLSQATAEALDNLHRPYK